MEIVGLTRASAGVGVGAQIVQVDLGLIFWARERNLKSFLHNLAGPKVVIYSFFLSAWESFPMEIHHQKIRKLVKGWKLRLC